MVNTTCQICERIIKANTGVIAHHGYTRPGDGWQTTSCMGARHLPYEVSKDILPPTIEYIKNFIARRSTELKEFVKNPPAVITTRPHWIGDPKAGKQLERPEGFNPKEEDYNTRTPFTYENEYSHMKYVMEKSIKEAKRDMAKLEKRLAEWKPVYTVEQWKQMTQ